jgi:copper transport protein
MRRGSLKILFLKALTFTFLLCLIAPVYASAHAILTNASPAYNSQLDRAPNEISLTFNERLQKDLYRITVYNDKAVAVCCEKAALSADQRRITLKLPELSQGHYTVTYVVISADGHPIQESYLFTVGSPLSAPAAPEKPGASLHAGHSVSGPEGYWAYRIFYFFALLLLAGWVLWRPWIPFETEETSVKYKRIARYIQFFYLITLIGFIIYQFSSFLLGWTALELFQIMPRTLTGLSWIGSIILSVIGFFVLLRWRWLDYIWIAMMLFCKSINGHAVASQIPWAAIILDFVHLTAAAVWVGGLTYLALFKKEDNTRFLALFSKAALLCIILLIVTGSVFTIIILPTLSYLFYTAWGILLLCKIGFVLLVVVTGAILRRSMKNHNQTEVGRWLNFDMIWMLTIVVIAAIFSYLNPIPANEPLVWTAGSTNMQMTASISPMQVGTNQFSVNVQSESPLKIVELRLSSSDKTEIAPLLVPLKLVDEGKNTLIGKSGDTGYIYRYAVEGPYLPFAGHWKAELKVIDSNDNEKDFTKKMMLFE